MKKIDLCARVILQTKDDMPEELTGNLILAMEQYLNGMSFDAKIKTEDIEFQTVVAPRFHFKPEEK
jgi:hypothetical protein